MNEPSARRRRREDEDSPSGRVTDGHRHVSDRRLETNGARNRRRRSPSSSSSSSSACSSSSESDDARRKKHAKKRHKKEHGHDRKHKSKNKDKKAKKDKKDKKERKKNKRRLSQTLATGILSMVESALVGEAARSSELHPKEGHIQETKNSPVKDSSLPSPTSAATVTVHPG
ncbi:hypothetical protein HK104_010916, partial [Borealophlyctis nickersoniae]